MRSTWMGRVPQPSLALATNSLKNSIYINGLSMLCQSMHKLNQILVPSSKTLALFEWLTCYTTACHGHVCLFCGDNLSDLFSRRGVCSGHDGHGSSGTNRAPGPASVAWIRFTSCRKPIRPFVPTFCRSTNRSRSRAVQVKVYNLLPAPKHVYICLYLTGQGPEMSRGLLAGSSRSRSRHGLTLRKMNEPKGSGLFAPDLDPIFTPFQRLEETLLEYQYSLWTEACVSDERPSRLSWTFERFSWAVPP